jgi:hypothetical protein
VGEGLARYADNPDHKASPLLVPIKSALRAVQTGAISYVERFPGSN